MVRSRYRSRYPAPSAVWPAARRGRFCSRAETLKTPSFFFFYLLFLGDLRGSGRRRRGRRNRPAVPRARGLGHGIGSGERHRSVQRLRSVGVGIGNDADVDRRHRRRRRRRRRRAQQVPGAAAFQQPVGHWPGQFRTRSDPPAETHQSQVSFPLIDSLLLDGGHVPCSVAYFFEP